MPTTKRDLMRQGNAETRPSLTRQDREDMREKLVSDEQRMHRKLIVLGAHDVEWMDQTVSILKKQRRKTNGSELIRLGLSLLREMNGDELQRRLREFE